MGTWMGKIYRKADTRALHLLSINELHPNNLICFVGFDLLDLMELQHLQTEFFNLLNDQSSSIPIKLPRQHPRVLIDQLDRAKLVQIHHGLRSLKSEKSTTDDQSRTSRYTSRIRDHALQISNIAVYKYSGGIVAWRIRRHYGVGAGGENENIVVYGGAGGGLHLLGFGKDLGHPG